MITRTSLSQLFGFVTLLFGASSYVTAAEKNANTQPTLFEKVDISGRLQLDAARFLTDEHNTFTDRERVRRARLSTRLHFTENWLFELDYDFARDDRSAIRDLILQYREQNISVTAGQFKEPFSLERLTSRRDVGFLERSLVSALSPSRSLGIAFQQSSQHHTFAVGLFSSDFANYHTDTTGLTSRFTHAFDARDGYINHIGLSSSYRKVGRDTDIAYDQRIETRNSDIRLIDTGSLYADNFWLTGVEAAIARNTMAIKAEWVRNAINNAYQTPGQSKADVTFTGWHVDISWILSGEQQTYNHEKGTLGRLHPKRSVTDGGLGAWRFSTRLSQLDLNDSFVQGGKQRNLTSNLTWVLNKHVILMAEYVKVLSVSNQDARPKKPDFLQARLELAF